MSTHLIIGAGPVGTTMALHLANTGERVAVATRSGSGPEHPNVSRHRLDATNASELDALISSTGAATVINCANPPYTSWDTDWPPLAEAMLRAAGTSGAGLITVSNLYGYGPGHPLMTADTPLDATGTKGRVRADMWRAASAAHAAGRARVAEVRAGDYFGPGVLQSSMGERVLPRVLKGKGVQLIGNVDLPHSFSFMPDVAAVVAAVALDQSSWGRPWLVPSVDATQRNLVSAFAKAAGRPGVKVSTTPAALLKVLGLVVPMIRELQEIRYQFDAPFVADATDTVRKFGLRATPLDEAAAATVGWWRDRG